MLSEWEKAQTTLVRVGEGQGRAEEAESGGPSGSERQWSESLEVSFPEFDTTWWISRLD